MVEKIKEWVFGKPKHPEDPEVFHKVSLVTFFAWVGLGADGLSSSAYGPEEAYRALGTHTHLALFLVVMTAVTVFVISFAYSNLIKYFPGGGGGYLVATKLLGSKVGAISGCALLVDYVLTISVSIASGCDAIWSFLPPEWLRFKLLGAIFLLVFMLILNLRGVRESVAVLAPIFMLFIITHAFMIVYVLIRYFSKLPVVFHEAAFDFTSSRAAVGFMPVALILLRSYSMGAGTYTGIEAVSNGVMLLREPRVQTGRRTMMLMAVSLAFTAGGILFGYMLADVKPVAGRTMNAVLFDTLFGSWNLGGFGAGHAFVVLSLAAEAALLLIAAQAGFLGGPRVLANMAVDGWVPRRFSQLSDRLVTQNGVVLLGLAALATLLYTRGHITTLVIMYSINVFITFVLTELGMSRYCVKNRATEPSWRRLLALHGTGFLMCLAILSVIIFEKFLAGGWVTLIVTTLVILICFAIRRHYDSTSGILRRVDEILTSIPLTKGKAVPVKATHKPAAILMVTGYNGIGVHSFLAIHRFFPGHFKNFIFVSVGAVDSSKFKGTQELDNLENTVKQDLGKYVDMANKLGLYAEAHMDLETDVVEGLEKLCQRIGEEWPKKVYFMGQLAFEKESFFTRFLHNQTAFALQRRLIFSGFEAVILPIRVRETQRLPG